MIRKAARTKRRPRANLERVFSEEELAREFGWSIKKLRHIARLAGVTPKRMKILFETERWVYGEPEEEGK